MTTETPRLSYYIASILIDKTPAHAYHEHRLLGGHKKRPTQLMDEGRIFECLLMDHPLDFIEIIDSQDFKNKNAREQRDAALEQEKAPILKHKYDDLVEKMPEIKKALLSKGIDFSVGEKRKRVEWESNGVKKSGELDWMNISNGRLKIVDVKKTTNANPFQLAKHIPDMNYDVQYAFYTDWAKTAHPEYSGRIDYELVFFETKSIVCVTPVGIRGQMAWLGESKMKRAEMIWQRCIERNEWPDYTNKTIFLDPPIWSVKQEEEILLGENNE